MIKILTLLSFAASVTSSAFTLIITNPARYATNNVEIRIANNDCDNLGLSAQDVKDMVAISVGQYWNTVPSSKIRFHSGSFVDVAEDASLTDMKNSIEDNQIIIGCSKNSDLFDSANILAVGTMTVSAPARGIVAINNTAGSRFSSLSESNQRATLAHEMGHAIGIGHSTHEYALMYFVLSESIKQESLARDDSDAITFLYPNKSKVPFLLGSCGQIRDIADKDLWFNYIFVLSVLALFLMWFFVAGSFNEMQKPQRMKL
ncbi:matrixin family metalloprotease [bacterium]|nr:matrixin family metalloprotease [bacterium]